MTIKNLSVPSGKSTFVFLLATAVVVNGFFVPQQAFAASTTNITTGTITDLTPATATQGEIKVPIVSFEITTSVAAGEKFKSIKTRWTGTAASPNTDIDNVYLYQESGTISGSSFSSTTDTLKDTTAAGGGTEINLDPTDITLATSTTYKFYIVVDIDSGATVGNTVDFKIETDKITFNSGTWPSAADITANGWDPAGSTSIISSITTDEIAQVGPVSVLQSATKVPIVSFTLSNTDSTEKFKSIKTRWTGTAASPNTDIDNVYLYQESGTISGSSFSSTTDTLKDTTAAGGGTEINLNPTDFFFDPQAKFYVVVDIKAGATLGNHIDFKVETDKITLTSQNWPPTSEVTAGTWNPAGDTVISPPTATLTVIKIVTNNNGGTKVVSNFPLFIDGFSVTSGGASTTAVGLHTVSETNQTGYTASIWGGDCAADGTITLTTDQNKTCTITNDDIAPSLTLVKEVEGGDADPEDWTLTATGDQEDPFILSGEGGAESASDFQAGTYTLSESAGPENYVASGWECTGSGSQNGNQMTLDVGESATCTITNTFVPPGTIVIVKETIGGDGTFDFESGELGSFSITTSGGSGNQTFSNVEPGEYSVSETGTPNDWDFSGASCDNDDNPSEIELGEDETVICTFTNTYTKGTLIVEKILPNDNGGTASPEDFSFSVNGGESLTFEENNVNEITVPVGIYTITEPEAGGFSTSYENCTDVEIGPGETKTCTITNDDIAPTITLNKIVINDNGGTAGVNDFGLSVGGTAVSSGETFPVSANIPIEILELNLTGYSFVSITGDEGCPSELRGTVTLELDEHITCTITNDDDPPQPVEEVVVRRIQGQFARPIGQVLGTFTEAERKAQIATIRVQLVSLINQLITLLQAQLAAAIQAP